MLVSNIVRNSPHRQFKQSFILMEVLMKTSYFCRILIQNILKKNKTGNVYFSPVTRQGIT